MVGGEGAGLLAAYQMINQFQLGSHASRPPLRQEEGGEGEKLTGRPPPHYPTPQLNGPRHTARTVCAVCIRARVVGEARLEKRRYPL